MASGQVGQVTSRIFTFTIVRLPIVVVVFLTLIATTIWPQRLHWTLGPATVTVWLTTFFFGLVALWPLVAAQALRGG